MSKFDPGNLLWFGAAPVPPQPSPYLLGWNPALRKFKPFGLPVKQLARYSKASSDFVTRTKSMLDNVHPGIQAVLIKYGVAVWPVGDIYDASMWLSWDGPRGHGDRFTWKTISGLCLFEGHLLVLCECREDGTRYIRCDNRQGVFNHELGHCLDRALALISASPEFLACYAADFKQLSDSNKALYRYLLQPDLAGPSELFTECFAATQGLGCFPNGPKNMPEYFPSSYQFVSDLVGRLTSSFQQENINAL